MGFVEDNIMDGENIIYRAKLHRIIFLLPGVFVVLFLIVLLLILIDTVFPLIFSYPLPKAAQLILRFARTVLVANRYFHGNMHSIYIDRSLTFLIPAIVTGIIPLINYCSSEFAVTNKRVLVKHGFIRRRSTEVLLTKIEGIVVDQSILGRPLGYGTVIISGTGSLKNQFKRISNPLEFRKRVQDQISSQN